MTTTHMSIFHARDIHGDTASLQGLDFLLQSRDLRLLFVDICLARFGDVSLEVFGMGC